MALPSLPGLTLPIKPVSTYTQYYKKPVGVRKVGDKRFMHNTMYEWTGSHWKCLDPSKRKFTVVRKIKGIEAKKKALEDILDLKPGSGLAYGALQEAVAAGGMEAWRKLKEAGLPTPKIKPVPTPLAVPGAIEKEGDFVVLAGEGIKDKTTGQIIGYIGPNNTLMDIHGTVIGSYVGDRKTVDKVHLVKFVSVPERQGIPYCAKKNYDLAKKYLVDLMEAGEIPGGSVLVQRHGAWVYIPPTEAQEWLVLDTGEKMHNAGRYITDATGKKVYFPGYDDLSRTEQDYLNKYGISSFNTGYIPAQVWLAEERAKEYQRMLDKLNDYFIESAIPPYIENPVFVKFIKGLSGYNLIQIIKDKVLPTKDLYEIFGKKAVGEAKRDIQKEPAPWAVYESDQWANFKTDFPEWTELFTEHGGGFKATHAGVAAMTFPSESVLGAGKLFRKIKAEAKAQGYAVPGGWRMMQLTRDYDNWVGGLPTKHPAKITQIYALGEQLAFAAIPGTPQVWAGVGAVGRALTVAKLGRFGLTLPLVGRVTPNTIPWLIVGLARITTVSAPVAITGTTIEESLRATDLDHKWEAFQKLSTNTQDYWAKQSGYTVGFGKLEDTQKANVLLHYSVPADYTMAQWSETLDEYREKLLEYSAKGAGWLRERANWRVSEPLIIGGGAAVGVTLGVSYMAQLPLIAGSLAYQVPKGTAKDYTTMIAVGMALFFTQEIPKMVKADPALGIGTVVGLFLLSPGGLIKFGKGLGVKGSFRYVPERGMAVEANSLRVGAPGKTPKEFNTMWQKLTEKQRVAVIRQLAETLHKSDASKVTVTIRGTRWSIEVLNVPYQRVVKHTSWAATPDITKFGDVVKIGRVRLYPSPELAIRFMLSTSKGKTGKHPGVIEVHSSIADTAYKTLGKGEVELEIPLQYKTLDIIKGHGGKGVSANAYVGNYPIRRYTIRGEKLSAWKGPTGKQLAEVRLLSAKEGAIDALVGWHHRWKTVKQATLKDPRIRELDASIKRVKSEKPELTKILANGQHQILYQRHAIPHPTSGEIKPRVKGVIIRADGRVMLVKDRSGKAYELPGGSVDIKDLIIRGKFVKDASKVTWEQALASQVMGETMVGLTKIKYLDIYTGKVNEHGLSGARIFEATAVGKANRITAWKRYQRAKYGYPEPELKDIVWWKPGDKGVEVLPSTIDILKARMSTSGLRLYEASKMLNKARDTGFADRVKSGKQINEADIAKINEVELRSLQDRLKEILKGEEFDIKEYFKSSEDMALLMELIKSRRTAVEYIESGIITMKQITALRKTPELFTQKGWQLIDDIWTLREAVKISAKESGRKLTAKDTAALRIDIERSFSTLLKARNSKLGKLKEELEGVAYMRNEGYYNRAYSGYYYGLSRPKVGYPGRVPYQDEKKIATRYNALLERDRTPIPMPVVARVTPPRRKITKGVPAIVPPPKDRREVRPIRVPPPRVPPTVPPPKILLPKDTISRLTKEERKGIIAWKQGIMYKLIYPPYYQDDIINSRKPLAGVKYHTGVGSAYRSVLAKGGVIPREVLRDMGIMDLRFRTTRPTSKKPKLFYKRDIKQRTRTTPGISGIR